MNKIDLSKKLKENTYLVNVTMLHKDHEPELISSGSAFCINQAGYLITAAHVVTGRLPIRKEDVEDPNIIIVAKSEFPVLNERFWKVIKSAPSNLKM